jgi:hypothetical protein
MLICILTIFVFAVIIQNNDVSTVYASQLPTSYTQSDGGKNINAEGSQGSSGDASKGSSSANKAASGLLISYTTYQYSPNMSRAEAAKTAEDAINAGDNVRVTFVPMNGKNVYCDLACESDWYEIYNLLVAASRDGAMSNSYFDLCEKIGIGDQARAAAALAKAGKSAEIPVVFGEVAIVMDGAETAVCMHDVSMVPVTTASADDISKAFNNSVDTTMASVLLGTVGTNGHFRITVSPGETESGSQMYIYYATIIDPNIDINLLSKNYIIGSASPKNAVNNWDVIDSVTGTYMAKAIIGDDTVKAFTSDTGMLKIIYNINFNYQGDLQVVSVKRQTSKWDKTRLVSETVSVSGYRLEYDIYPNEYAEWNNSGQQTFTVTIKGGSNTNTEQKNWFLATAKIGETSCQYISSYNGVTYSKDWVSAGGGGKDYASWVGKPDVPDGDQPYDYHSQDTPTIEQTVYGNEIGNNGDNQDWNVSGAGAIPSTENVSLDVSASAGMFDIAGYMCARTNNVVNVNSGEDIEDSTGNNNSSSVVKRKIELVSQVTNCWGQNNNLCQLTPTKISNSGGSSSSASASTKATCGSGHDASKHGKQEKCPNNHGADGDHNGTWDEHKYESWSSHSDCGTITHSDGTTSAVPKTHGQSCSHSHNCKWSYTIQDAVDNDDWLGESGLADSGSISGTIVSGQSLNHSLLKISIGSDCDYQCKYSLSWSPTEDRQAYYVVYSLKWSKYGCSHNHSDPPPATVSGSLNTTSTVFCSDYTHGTGSNIDHNENMVHQATHKYTLTYYEQIDAYVYRTITNCQLYGLTGIAVNNVNQITRTSGTSIDGISYDAGTYSAPLEDSAIDRGVSSPDAIGVLYRCTDKNNGEYRSGNGRIYFEQWKDVNAKPDNSGNVSIILDNNDYFLGDCTVKISAVQDSNWHTGISNEDDWEPEFDEVGITNRGSQENHIHSYGYKSNDKAIVTATDKKYLQNKDIGDCTGEFNASSYTDNENAHNADVKKELKALMNFWEGKNKPDDGEEGYSANIIPDSICYGGTTDTNNILDDAYAVDDTNNTVKAYLFNVHCGDLKVSIMDQGGIDSTGSKTVYRSHISRFGVDKQTLYDQLDLVNQTNTGNQDGFDLVKFGDDKDGGSKSLSTALAYCLYSSNYKSYENANKYDVKFARKTAQSSSKYSGYLKLNQDKDSAGSGVSVVTLTKRDTRGSNITTSGLYWREHTYKTIVNDCLKYELKAASSSTTGYTDTYSDSGQLCLEQYKNRLGISNLSLVEWTPNGSWKACQVRGDYMLLLSLTGNQLPADSGNWSYNYDTHENHSRVASNDSPALSEYLKIIIYDPVSIENSFVVGNQEGAWGDNVSDDRDYDQRVELNEDGDWVQVNQDSVDSYALQSRELWTWLSPIGDFSSCNLNGIGDGFGNGYGSNTKTGEIYECKGYVKNMNTNRWIADGAIQYPFVDGIENSSTDSGFSYRKDINKPVSITNMDWAYSYPTGDKFGAMGLHPTSLSSVICKLTNSSTKAMSKHKDKVYFGNGFGSYATIDCYEGEDLPVSIYAYAINCFTKSGDNTAEFGYNSSPGKGTNSNSDSPSDEKPNNAVVKDYVDMVGSIGNIAIHDTEDFRFSNYFKISTSEWLIDGVIHKVDLTQPAAIISTMKDIVFQDVKKVYGKGGYGHATTGITVYEKGSGGMAGTYSELPLKPSDNNVDEYKSSAVRLGYKSYMSVETIGNYYSSIYDYKENAYKLPDGPGDEDTRENYLEVDSVYYLYDLTDGKFYDIDLWSGASGSKERLYNGTTHKSEYISKAGAIYQDVNDSEERRNIGTREQRMTAAFAGLVNTSRTDMTNVSGEDSNVIQDSSTYMHASSHYIGTPGKIKLDTRDLSYIGSSSNTSMGMGWGDYIYEPSTSQESRQSQRYHFITGLTSTTIPTSPLGANPTQQEVEIKYEELKKEHPYAVIVEFQEYTAVGSVWTIQTKGYLFNRGSFTLYNTSYYPEGLVEEVGEDKIKNTVNYWGSSGNGADVYDPMDESKKLSTIDKDLTPVIVYEAYHTSAEDRSVSGTH